MKKTLILSAFSLFILWSCATPRPRAKVVTRVVKEKVEVPQNSNKSLEKINPGIAHLKDYRISSDYYPAVGHDERVRFLILHYTALDTNNSLNVLTQQQVSSHYLIPEEDYLPIYRLVDESKRAWHAGLSYWKGINNVNFSSIGIEIVNLGYSEKKEIYKPKEYIEPIDYFYDFEEHQIKKVAALAVDIINRYNIDPVNVLGHEDVAPQRKSDPGPKFPWKRLYTEYNIGAWYEDAHKNIYLRQYPYDKIDDYSFILSVQQDFAKYGYEIQLTGTWDKQTEKVISKFQHHFRPERFDGTMDAETWAILQSLILKYRS